MSLPWDQPRNSLTLNGKPNGQLDEDDYQLEVQLHQRLIRDIDESAIRGLSPDRARDAVERATRTLAGDMFPQLVGDAKEDLVHRIADEVVGLGPIERLVRDPEVSEVMVNAPDEVLYEREGVIHESEVTFRDS